MNLIVDLLAIPCAEYCERGGVKGVFIPETPNLRYQPSGDAHGRKQDRAFVSISLFKTSRKKQRYDYMGKMRIWPEFQEAYLSNPNTVNRRQYIAYGYNFLGKQNETNDAASSPEEFARLLED